MTEQQFEEYITAHRATVFRLAYSMTKNREDADDITQEAFVRLYLTSERFDTTDNVKAWLIRVAINLCKDLLRSCAYRRRTELCCDIPCESESGQTLLEYVRQLKPDDSAVIYLFYYEGYSVIEIARLRHTTSAAVRTRLTRARKKLREMLTKEGES